MKKDFLYCMYCKNSKKCTAGLENCNAFDSKELSENFSLWEFVKSDKHPDLISLPDKDIIANLKAFCRLVMQPMRNELGAIQITSGYRSKKLNRAVKGTKNSAHIDGLAADFRPLKADIFIAAKWIAEYIPFTCLIIYPEENRLHIDIKITDKPKRVLEKIKGGYKVWIS